MVIKIARLLQTKGHRILRNHVSESLTKYDITLAEWAILGLVEHEKKKLGEIAAELDVEAPLITRLVEALYSKNLIEKVSDPEDKRAKRIVISQKGAALMPDIEKDIRKEMQKLLKGISEEEILAYFKVLEAIIKND